MLLWGIFKTMKSNIYKLVIAWLLLLLWLSLTNPTHLSVFAIFIVFSLIYAVLYAIVNVVCLLLFAPSQASVKRAKSIATIAATLGVITAALQSIGQLSAKDIIVASAVVILGYFYLRRTRTKE